MGKLRVGIIGTGFGTTVQAPGFMLHPEFEVVALCGVARPERAQQEAAKLGIPHVYDNYETMLREAKLDLISIVSSVYMHHPMVLAIAERGIPILCEKPLARNLTEALEMVDAVERRGLFAAVDHEYRHWPARTIFRQMVKEGFLGDLLHFNLTYSMPGHQTNLARPMGWLWEREKGGGMLFALGSHLIDTVQWTFGPIRSVSGTLTAHVETRNGQTVTADDTFAFLTRMDGKATGYVQLINHAHHGFGIRLEAFGSKGTLVMAGDKTILAGKPGEKITEIPVPARYDVPGVELPPEYANHSHIPPFVVVVDNLANALRQTGAPGPSRDLCTMRESAAVQAVLDSVLLSHQERRWVDVPKLPWE